MFYTERKQECSEHWVPVPDDYQPNQGEILVEVHLICDEKPKHFIVPGLTPNWLVDLKQAAQYAEQTLREPDEGGTNTPMSCSLSEVVEVIRVVEVVGTGAENDPVRTEVSYWSKRGKLITKMDINDDPYSPLHPL